MTPVVPETAQAEDIAPPAAPTSRRRRILTWVALSLVFVVLAIGLFAVSTVTAYGEKRRLQPDHHGPDSFKALSTVLSEQGVEVIITRSWKDAAEKSRNATLTMIEPSALSDEGVSTLIAQAKDVVLLQPTHRSLRLTMDASMGSAASGALTDSCAALPGVTTIKTDQLYEGGTSQCFMAGGDAAIISTEHQGRSVTALDGVHMFSNSTITQADNAAVALHLLGKNERLVWYVPTSSDTDLAAGSKTMADLAPDWVTPVLLLGFVTAIAAGIWRGRRFGPLVAERLPVTVRVSETMEGRARLYARSRDASHAANILRASTAASVGSSLGLGRRAPVQSVAEAAAVVLAVDAAQIQNILAGPVPQTDADLVALSDKLRTVEAAVRAAVRAEGKRP